VLTGAWSRGLQPGIPDTVEAIIAEGVACARAGAAIIHIHAYDDGRQQTLDWQVYENTRTSKSLKTLAIPPRFEPGTFSLEDARSRNDINARSDIFTVRAAFEAIAEFRFVGMLAAGWCASRLRCRSSLLGFEPHLIHDRRRRPSERYGIQYAGRSIYFRVPRLWQDCGKSLELARLGLDVLGLNRPVTALVVLDKIGQNVQLGGFWSVPWRDLRGLKQRHDQGAIHQDPSWG
jgi:hypothetical protein